MVHSRWGRYTLWKIHDPADQLAERPRSRKLVVVGLRREHHAVHEKLAQNLPRLRYVTAQQPTPVVQTRVQVVADPLAVVASRRMLPLESGKI